MLSGVVFCDNGKIPLYISDKIQNIEATNLRKNMLILNCSEKLSVQMYIIPRQMEV
jgi:hypothetical protein